MEEKKILWILFSAVLFLAIVVGAGFLWFFPDREGQVAAEITAPEIGRRPADFDPVEWVRGSEERPGLEESKPDDDDDERFVIVYTEGPDGVGEVRMERESPRTPPAAAPVQKPKETTPVQPAAPAVREPAPAPRPPEKIETRTVQAIEYWIQAGSFTRRFRADTARETLNEKGFAARIISVNIEGTDYYRVRIGPYPNKAEAEKFLDWVKEVDSFGSSYVSQVHVRRQVN